MIINNIKIEWKVESDISAAYLRDRLDTISSLGYRIFTVLGPYPPIYEDMPHTHTIIARKIIE